MMQELGLKGEAGGGHKDKTKKKLQAETRVCAKAQRQESTGKQRLAGGWSWDKQGQRPKRLQCLPGFLAGQ